MHGDNGIDNLYGGAGRDTLTGGHGSDLFTWKAASETGVTASTRDVITDFKGGGVAGGDTIDLSGLDAIPGGTDDGFTFKGTDAFDGLGQVRVRFENGNTVV